MDVIEQIGAYAGFASVLGLAVLAALYFSQARDVKRLREWAGRAPERVPITRPPVVARPMPPPRPPGQATMPPRPPVPPVPRPPGAAPGVPPATPAGAPPPGAPPPGAPPGTPPRPPGAPPAPAPAAPPATPAAQPAPAASASTAGAAPSEVKGPAAPEEPGDDSQAEAPETTVATDSAAEAGAPSPATPAAAAGTAVPAQQESQNGNEEVSQDTAVHPPVPPEDEEEDLDHDEPPPEEDEELEHELYEEEELEPDAPERHWEDTGDIERTGPVPGRPTIPIGAGRELDQPVAGSQPPILPPYSQSRPTAEPPGGPERAGLSTTGRILGVVGATCIAAAIVALAIVQLNGDDGGSEPAAERSEEQAPAEGEARSERPAVDPTTVTVAVLNGTTVPGLAAKIGNSVKRRGFQLGTVTNFIDQQRAESVVMYAPGAERAAADVGRRLDIAQRAPVDAESQDIAGDATVVVIAGADQTP